jgi:hypothetical protein
MGVQHANSSRAIRGVHIVGCGVLKTCSVHFRPNRSASSKDRFARYRCISSAKLAQNIIAVCEAHGPTPATGREAGAKKPRVESEPPAQEVVVKPERGTLVIRALGQSQA